MYAKRFVARQTPPISEGDPVGFTFDTISRNSPDELVGAVIGDYRSGNDSDDNDKRQSSGDGGCDNGDDVMEELDHSDYKYGEPSGTGGG